MLKKFITKTFFQVPEKPPEAEMEDIPSETDLAAKLLIASTAIMPMSQEEARVVVGYMQPQTIAQDTIFIRQGDSRDTGFMLLLLDGEVTVENIVVSRIEPITISVLGPGSLIGELGLVDGEPRYASCIASTPVHCLVLTRQALQQLVRDNPTIAAKFLLAITSRIAARLRDNTDKLKMYVQLTQAMQQELSARSTF